MNMSQVNFLDVTLKMIDGTYRQHRKPNDCPLYINKHSNHPPNIVKNLSLMIGKRLSSISSNKNVFDEANVEYEEALRASAYRYATDLKFNEFSHNAKSSTKKRRERKVT